MRKERQILLAMLGVALVAAGVGEHWFRRLTERRLREAVEDRRKLELQFGEVLATHLQVQEALKQERQRSHELSDALASMQKKMEEATDRLAEGRRTVRELQLRLAALQQQTSQLQGELSVALQQAGQAGTKGGESAAVQLERVVVSDVGAPTLQGRVVSVHRDWNFVVINFGWDTVRIGDTVSIFRNDHLLAKARVERVQEGVCAATILPEWETTEVHVNDLVRVL